MRHLNQQSICQIDNCSQTATMRAAVRVRNHPDPQVTHIGIRTCAEHYAMGRSRALKFADKQGFR